LDTPSYLITLYRFHKLHNIKWQNYYELRIVKAIGRSDFDVF